MITRFGSRYMERLADAAHRAERKARAQQALSPGDLVSAMARTIDLEQEMAQQLSHALNRRVDSFSWIIGVTPREVTYLDGRQLLYYYIQVQHSYRRQRTWRVPEATVAANTRSTSIFNDWMDRLANGLVNASLNEHSAPWTQSLYRMGIEGAGSAGLPPIEPVSVDMEAEEQAAIESIKKALDVTR